METLYSACEDTPNWNTTAGANGDTYTCADMESRNYCDIVEERWTTSAAAPGDFASDPRENCCACGRRYSGLNYDVGDSYENVCQSVLN